MRSFLTNQEGILLYVCFFHSLLNRARPRARSRFLFWWGLGKSRCESSFVQRVFSHRSSLLTSNDRRSRTRASTRTIFWGEKQPRIFHFTYTIYLCSFIAMEPLFDHEKLDVYCVELQFTTWIADFLCDVLRSSPQHRRELIDQLDRASLSMLLNTAEGNGKRHGRHRAKFFDDARGSAFECAACLDALLPSPKSSSSSSSSFVLGRFPVLRRNSPIRSRPRGPRRRGGLGQQVSAYVGKTHKC